MATKEPLRRCVRCKTKKKGCSRGSPCERCALAGLTAEECIYLESDSTYRNIKPKRKEPSIHANKSTTTTTTAIPSTKLNKSFPNGGPESRAIVRCSRCIRTARGCSHERPCQPCREGGLSEWECRYTSASSFKVRGPGARDLRRVRSLEKIGAVLALDPTSGEETATTMIERVLKKERSHSTNSAPTRGAQLIIDQIPRDYRTPSPPTNISPISEPANWRERTTFSSPTQHDGDVGDNTTPRKSESLAVPIPGVKQRFVVIDSNATTMSRTNSATGLPAGSVEPPPMMTLIHSVSQQSHANTLPESSPAIYTDDYQSSPSPYNSPQFQSSPPVHMQSGTAIQRNTTTTFQNESPMFPPQTPYRPPAGYAVHSQSRHFAVPQTHNGFYLSQSPQNTPQQQFQHLVPFAQSPPYGQQYLAQYPHPQQQSYAQQHTPRPRAVPSPSPRFASPGPYTIPPRQHSYQGNVAAAGSDVRQQAYTQAVPIRISHPSQNRSYTTFSASPLEHDSSAMLVEEESGDYRGDNKSSALHNVPAPSFEQQIDYHPFEQDARWHESELDVFGQTDTEDGS